MSFFGDLLAQGQQGAQPNFGNRADGTPKGSGFFGVLRRPDGQVSTELSVGVNLGGKEVEIPALVPTLTRQEINHLLNGGAPTDDIVRKAVEHARSRLGQGQSPFAEPSEPTMALPEDDPKNSIERMQMMNGGNQ